MDQPKSPTTGPCTVESRGAVIARDTDYSNCFNGVRRHIRNSEGVFLIDFVKSLEPHYRVAYYDIALGYAALLLTMAVAIASELAGVPSSVIVPVGMLLVGYWIAYLQLFLHEGAHWHLAPDRELSDRICNSTVAWLAGINVKRYRKVHFQHHRALGTREDSENTYFFPLNLLFLGKGLLGLRAMEVILSRRKFTAESEMHRRPGHEIKGKEAVSDRQLLLGIIIHLSLLAFLMWLGSWAAAAVWLLGLAVIFPFFASLRQLLEHRDETAEALVDYRLVDHGAVTRMFGDGPFASTFGGAGFNRHLLHHWEPTVSYTRLKDLEAFLADTPLQSAMAQRTTTYGRTLVRLFWQGMTSAR